jgi:hypothetical protein
LKQESSLKIDPGCSHPIVIESASNQHQIESNQCQLRIKSLSNWYQILIQSTSNQHQLGINLASNPQQFRIASALNQNQLGIKLSSDRHQIRSKSASNQIQLGTKSQSVQLSADVKVLFCMWKKKGYVSSS